MFGLVFIFWGGVKWGESELIILINKNMGIDTIPQAPQDDKKDVPAAQSKAEGQKLEWGPELDPMSWNDAQERITELNAGLAEGEKPWRLPTFNDFFTEYIKAGEKIPVNFHHSHYWTGDTYWNNSEIAYCFNMYNAFQHTEDKGKGSYCVRLVRDAA